MTDDLKTSFSGHCDAHHPMLAAVDLGTNSCRLLIAAVNVAGLKKSPYRSRFSSTPWRVVDSFGKIVRLGEGLHKSELLSEDAMDRALEALTICRQKIDVHGVKMMRLVATEACRRAENGQDLMQRVKSKLDLDIEIISSDEEARLAITGCAAVLNSKIPYAIIFDIGGGSTELVFVRLRGDVRQRPGYPIPFDVIDSISVPYGVVTVSESYAQFASTPEIHLNIRQFMMRALEDFVVRHNIMDLVNANKCQILGSSGTVTTLGAIFLDLPRYEKRAVDGLDMSVEDIHTISQSILNMHHTQRLEHPCIGGGREDLVIVGSAILEGIFDAIPAQTLRIADRGVREGILTELMTSMRRFF